MADSAPTPPKTPKPSKTKETKEAPTPTPAPPPPEVEEVEKVSEVPPEEVEEIDDDVDDEDIDIDESFDGALFDPMHQLTQVLVTESGTPLVDVVQGIQDALEKQNKILYKLVSVVEAKLH